MKSCGVGSVSRTALENVVHRSYYGEFAWAYDLLIRGPVESRCDFWQEISIERGVRLGSRILDAGCGTGEYAIELARRGYEITGLDASRELISVARRKLASTALFVAFQVGDILKLSTEKRYAAILARGVLNDITDDADRQQVFFSLARALRKGGILFLDAREWHATALRKIREPSFVKTVESAEGTLIFRSFTRLDLESRKLLVRECHALEKEGGETVREYDFVMRCWTSEELRTGLVRAGFGSIACFGDYDRDKLLGSTDRIVAVASLH